MIRSILRSKTRSLLTMSGIAVGVFAVVIISFIGTLGSREVESTLFDMGINSVLVQPKQQGLTAAFDGGDVEKIMSLRGVKKAMPLMASNTETMLRGQNNSCLLWGITADAGEVISLKAIHGRLISRGENFSAKYTANSSSSSSGMVCVIDEEIALKTYGRSNIVGKTAKILLGGTYREFEIIGVASSGLSALQGALTGIIPSFVYIPFNIMQELSGRSGYDKIAVLLDAGQDEDGGKVSLDIESAITGANASNLLQQKEQLEGIMGTVTLALSLIAGISLVVSGLTVMTTMLVSVNERKREIGVKKSVGAKDFDILKEFLAESMLMSLLGSLAGAVFAILATFVGCGAFGIGFAADVGGILLPVGVSVIMGALFGAYPALKAARLEPIIALRN